MKLPHSISNYILQDNFDALVTALHGKELRVGSATAVFAASATASTVVPHGLRRTPVAAFATPVLGAGFLYAISVSALDATNVTFLSTGGGVFTANIPFYWLVVG
jgi:hypothetical protein